MEFLLSTPYILRVLISLFVILVVNKLIKQLWIAIIAGTALLALWCGHTPGSMMDISLEKISSTNTILFLVIVLQIIWLSIQMSETGVMKDLVYVLKSRISTRASIAILPAIIGMLPMPGGAIFSAPLVDDCDEDRTIDPILKTKINYWFRHVWEYWWPLYPGVLLVSDLTGISITSIMALHLPLSVVSVAAGYFFLLRKVPVGSNGETAGNPGNPSLFMLTLPILIIISCYALIKLFIPAVSEMNKYLPMIIGIFSSQVFLQGYRPLGLNIWKKIFSSMNAYKMLLLVLLILLYGSFIDSKLPDGSMLVTQMRSELDQAGIPAFFIIIIIPFICGIVTGIAVGFVGTSFPIVLSLIGLEPSNAQLLATTVLAFGAGYTGMILSPVHICLIVTNQHFNTRIGTSIFRLVKPAMFIFLASVVIHFVLLNIM